MYWVWRLIASTHIVDDNNNIDELTKATLFNFEGLEPNWNCMWFMYQTKWTRVGTISLAQYVFYYCIYYYLWYWICTGIFFVLNILSSCWRVIFLVHVQNILENIDINHEYWKRYISLHWWNNSWPVINNKHKYGFLLNIEDKFNCRLD